MTKSNQSLLKIGDRTFHSRLLAGTGKFSSSELMREALAASETEIVTVALRRADLSGKKDPFANILEYIDSDRYLLLPNTSGAMDADEAVRLARLAVAAGLPKWVKLEIHPDPRYLLPDPIETLKAAETLVKEGFRVALHQCRSCVGQAIAGGRNRYCHAIGGAHWVESRYRDTRPDSNHHRAVRSACGD